jgi:hypothetical protein
MLEEKERKKSLDSSHREVCEEDLKIVLLKITSFQKQESGLDLMMKTYESQNDQKSALNGKFGNFFHSFLKLRSKLKI